MKKGIYKRAITHQETFVDVQTGEVVGTETKGFGYMANTKEEFLLIYSSLLGIFMNMEQAEIRVYGYLLRYANGIDFSISKPLREKMSIEIHLNERTIYNTLQTLKQKNLLYEQDSLFRINPRYAFRGGNAERNQALKILIELGCENC